MNATISFMIQTESAGGVVRNSLGEIALVRHGSTNFWGFPKGHVDPGETPLDAAKREIAEEAGIEEITYVRDLGAYERYKSTPEGGEDKSELKHIRMFLFTSTQRELVPKDPNHPEARWVAPQNVEKTLTHSKDREFWVRVLRALD